MTNALVALLFCFILTILLISSTRLRDKAFKGRGWKLFRALFPSWRFFEDLDYIPQLWFRIVGDGPSDENSWRECFAPEKRYFHSVFLNARSNFRMAAHSLVEQLMSDVAEMSDGQEAEDSVSYALVQRLVRYRIREMFPGRGSAHFQFKVVAVLPGESEHEAGPTVLLSAIHEV